MKNMFVPNSNSNTNTYRRIVRSNNETLTKDEYQNEKTTSIAINTLAKERQGINSVSNHRSDDGEERDMSKVSSFA